MPTFNGTAGNDTLTGSSGTDSLYGLAGADRILTGDGNDYVEGGDGDDEVNAYPTDASGRYSYFTYSGKKRIYGNGGNDFLFGGTDSDSIYGGDGNDTIYGFNGSDSLVGDAGNDKLYGGSGNDSFSGGEGSDDLSGEDGDDSLDGGVGDDTLRGGTGDDRYLGGDGNDYLSDTGGNNFFDGGGGNDTVFGDLGADTVLGGAGNDSVIGWGGNDSIDGEDGDDTLSGGDGDDSLLGGAGDDSLQGGAGNNLLSGGTGNDSLVAQGTGHDSLFGGDGNDRLNAYTGLGTKLLDGGAGDDTVYGGDGNDSLIGGDGNDYLHGNAGNDTLVGGGGVDEIYGGAGDDVYYISNQYQYVYDSAGADTAYVSASFVKVPSSIEKVIYTNGAIGLPYWIDALLPDEASGSRYSELVGASKTFLYAFPTAVPSYVTRAKDINGWKPFDATQQSRAVTALNYIASVVDLKFSPSTTTNAPNILTFASNDQTGSDGYAFHPDEASFGSDVYIDNSTTSDRTFRDGTYGALTLIHEIGHALGLKHPGDYNATGGETDPPYLPTREDTTAFTVMSYTDSPAQYYLRFSVLDIAALHYLYGPSKTARATNDSYSISTTDSNFIWDGVGTDTITAASCNQGCTIYLTPGYWGYVGATKAAYITDPGQITVNFGTVIENLTGSSYGDTLVGNDTANSIVGGLGNDTITGGGGNDTLDGGDGAGDVVVFSGVFSSYGIRLLQVGGESAIFADKTLSRDGVDTVSGFEIFRFADGDKTKAQILAVASPTAVKWTGTDGRDSYIGGAGNDTILGLGGDDTLVGGDGADSIDGGSGDDRLEGGSGNDRIDGSEGADTVIFQGKLRDYRVTAIADVVIVTDSNVERDGADTLQRIECIRFEDFEINTGVKAVSQSVNRATLDRVIELYVAFFNRIPDANGLSYWLTQAKGGTPVSTIADTFYGAGVQYSSLTGFSASMTNADFVNVIYRNVLGRKDGADAEGLAYWTGELSSGRASRGTLVNTILDSAHTFKGNATFGYVADLLDNKIAVAKQIAVDWGLNYLTADASITNGMAIAKAVTATDTSAAVALVGVPAGAITLGGG